MKQPINTIIIDDEPACVANLSFYLSEYCPGIRVTATGHSLADARKIVQQGQIDLAFFDIQLFDRNIFELFDETTLPFDVVLVTAYDEYAIRAIRSEVFDYILKPLSRKEIVACYDRLQARHSGAIAVAMPAPGPANPAAAKMILKAGEQVYVVRHSDILYLKANGAYTEVVFWYNNQRKSVTMGKSINTMAQVCDAPFFYRVHKSYVVNMKLIRSVIKSDALQLLMMNDDIVPVAKRRYSDFIRSYSPATV